MKTQSETRAQHALALYELTVSDGSFEVTNALTSRPFDLAHYSEFKYGRRDVAEIFGAAIAAALAHHFMEAGQDQQPIVVMGTPYKRVPNAARMLAIIAERYLRLHGFDSSYTTIYQHRLGEGDYGTLTVEEREARNLGKKRFIDPSDFAGKHVVLVDDIRITGSIERSTLALLTDVPVLSTVVFNLVKLDPEVALREPHLEDKLNHSAMTGLRDLLQLMEQPDQFVLTTRAVKYILQSDPAEVRWLMSRLGPTRTAELYDAAVDEGYDRMPRYEQAFHTIRSVIS